MIGNHKIVSLCISRLQDNSSYEFTAALNEKLSPLGYSLFVYNTCCSLDNDTSTPKGQASVFELIDYKKTDVLIVYSEKLRSNTITDSLINSAKKAEIPVIVIEGNRTDCICINFDNAAGFEMVAKTEFPNVTNIGEDRFIAEIEDGTLIGYKYFEFDGVDSIAVTARIETAENKVIYTGPVRIDERCVSDNKNEVRTEKHAYTATVLEIRLEENGESVGEISIGNSAEWTEYKTNTDIPNGVHTLYFVYHGSEKIQLKEISF